MCIGGEAKLGPVAVAWRCISVMGERRANIYISCIMKIVISIPFINCDFDGEEHYRDNCYFYSINKSDCRQESAMYNYHEK